MAFDFFGSQPGSEPGHAERTPPGQTLTDKFPVLHYGTVPRIPLARWRFRIFGLVERPVEFTYDQMMALPRASLTCDIHCVTTWSRLDNTFEGVRVRDLLASVSPRPTASHVMVHAEFGFTTNLALTDFDRDDVLLATRHNGQDLTPEHGWPLRLVVPRLYFWKSAKWVRGIEFMAGDRAGFWESNGYHMRGDPWNEERYADR
jgi:DMSO/TMAO reductase YedYZ molybdopterin-dependent catalytic subunit